MHHILNIPLLLFLVVAAHAQSGHSMRTIATTDPLLNGDSLDIYFHVPEGYQHGVPSRLIIAFHGLGDPDNSVQIREYMTPLGDSLNAIVMCPDPYLQDQPRSEAVLHLAYDSVMTWYDIDPAQVYIAGYSAGSDVAARYVFGEPQRPMRGLIWHSPGFFFSPDLSSPEEIPPVCLCSGTQDFTSVLQTNLLNSNLSNSSIPYLYIAMQGVGHTMDYPEFTATMLSCIDFIDSHYATGITESERTGLHVHPNPITEGGRLNISGIGTDAEVIISDMLGRSITVESDAALSGGISIAGLTELLGPGVYVLNVNAGSHRYSQRLVVR